GGWVLVEGGLEVALLDQQVGEPEVRRRPLWIDREVRPELRGGLVPATERLERKREVLAGPRVARVDRDRRLELGPRRIDTSGRRQSRAEVVVGDRVRARDGDRMLEERHRIAPEPDLVPAHSRECGENQRGAGRDQPPRRPQTRPGRGRLPGDGDEDADQRQIAVAIRHRLPAELYEADHRRQYHEIPEPTDREPGPAPPGGQRARAQRRERNRAAGDRDA